MRFWDSSALVPLLVAESSTGAIEALLEQDPTMLVWWAAGVECVSAVCRLERQGDLTSSQTTAALSRLNGLQPRWDEVEPAEPVRDTARRVLRTHPLRTADALQLASAIVAAEGRPAELPFVSLDERLLDAARREGFPVLGAPAV